MSIYSQFLFQSPLNEMSDKMILKTTRNYHTDSMIDRGKAKLLAKMTDKNQEEEDKEVIKDNYNRYINTQKKIANIKNKLSSRKR